MPELIMDAAHKAPTIRHPGPDGEVVVERIPATAPNQLGRGGRRLRRWILMLDHMGNQVRPVFTTGASEVVPQGKYKDRQWTKMLSNGWFPYGRCPLALVATGELVRNWIPERFRDDRPCDPQKHGDFHPCPHAIEIERQRKNRSADLHRKRQIAHQSDAARTLDKASQLQTASIEQLAESVKTLVAAKVTGADDPMRNLYVMALEQAKAGDNALADALLAATTAAAPAMVDALEAELAAEQSPAAAARARTMAARVAAAKAEAESGQEDVEINDWTDETEPVPEEAAEQLEDEPKGKGKGKGKR